MWTQGGCAILAFALNKAYSYPIYVIYDKDLNQADHFVVKTPRNTFLDYRGESKDIINKFKEDEMLWKKDLSLIPYEPGMNISDIVIDDKASNQLAELIKKNEIIDESHKRDNNTKEDKIIFLRNTNYSNRGNVKKIPYEGIHCWAVKESDLDKFFEQSYYQGADKKDFIEIQPNGNIYALNFKEADDYVKGNSEIIPTLEKFNPNKHTLRFKKSTATKPMYLYHSDLDYQILIIKNI